MADPQTTTSEEMVEEAIGLIARAAFRKEKYSGLPAAIDLLDGVSSFTTKMHIEARQRQARGYPNSEPNLEASNVHR
jgi:hypothetical protein